MAERVFFHIGAPKSGTTFLQTLMWRNKETLKGLGLLYPGRQRMDHFHATEVVRELTAQDGPNSTAWDLLCNEIGDWPGTALITHEFFGAASAVQARQALERLAPADVHLVFTARDYGRQFPAVWQEAVKMRTTTSLDDYVDKVLAGEISGPWGWSTQDVPAILERWGSTLDPRNVHVVTVPGSGAPRDLLWRRWCQVLQIPPDSCDLDVARSNESLGAAQAAFFLKVKSHIPADLRPGPERHKWLRGYLGHQVLVPQQGDRFGLRRRHLDELRNIALEEVEILASRGYDVAGDLEELIPSPPATELPNPADVADSELVEVAARAVATMTAEVRALSRDRDKWRRKARAASHAGQARQPGRGKAGSTKTTAAKGAALLRRVGRRLAR